MRTFKVRVWCNDSFRYEEVIESSTVSSAYGLAGRNLVKRTKGKFIQNASIHLENLKANGNAKLGEHLIKTPKKKSTKKRKKS